MTKYGVIVGSIRKNSYSLGVAEALVAGLPADADRNVAFVQPRLGCKLS